MRAPAWRRVPTASRGRRRLRRGSREPCWLAAQPPSSVSVAPAHSTLRKSGRGSKELRVARKLRQTAVAAGPCSRCRVCRRGATQAQRRRLLCSQSTKLVVSRTPGRLALSRAQTSTACCSARVGAKPAMPVHTLTTGGAGTRRPGAGRGQTPGSRVCARLPAARPGTGHRIPNRLPVARRLPAPGTRSGPSRPLTACGGGGGRDGGGGGSAPGGLLVGRRRRRRCCRLLGMRGVRNAQVRVRTRRRCCWCSP